MTVDIAAGAAQDSAGNPSAAADQFSITADLTPVPALPLPGAIVLCPAVADPWRASAGRSGVARYTRTTAPEPQHPGRLPPVLFAPSVAPPAERLEGTHARPSQARRGRRTVRPRESPRPASPTRSGQRWRAFPARRRPRRAAFNQPAIRNPSARTHDRRVVAACLARHRQ